MEVFREVEDRGEWDDFVDRNGGHALQAWGWGEVKSRHGWAAGRILLMGAGGRVIGGAQVLRRGLVGFGAILYVPRGPVVVDERDRGAVLDALAGWAGRYRGRCCFLSVEADWREMPEGLKRWRRSKNRILLADTVVVDLTRDRDELLAAMPKNRRQDIRKYQRSGLRLERVDDEVDFGKAMEIYKEIGRRAKFNLHEDGYYLDIWREMGEHQWLGVVKNERGEVIAFQWALMAGGNGFALFAGVGEEGRRRRINAGVKWECMGILKEMGVRKYDFNGLLNRGVNDYKRAFGGEDVRLVGTWDLPLSKLYTVYGEVFPIGKKITHLVEKVR